VDDAERGHVDEGLERLPEEPPALVLRQASANRLLKRLVLDILLRPTACQQSSGEAASGPLPTHHLDVEHARAPADGAQTRVFKVGALLALSLANDLPQQAALAVG
jgi:hypothetical protein